MKDDRDIEEILSNLSVRPDAKAKDAAYQRMMTRRAELLAADAEGKGNKHGGLLNNTIRSIKEAISSTGSNRELDPGDLAMAVGGQDNSNDYYDHITCFTQMPDSRCRIREGGRRCVHLSIREITGGAVKYRYVCGKGCFDYISDSKLH